MFYRTDDILQNILHIQSDVKNIMEDIVNPT